MPVVILEGILLVALICTAVAIIMGEKMFDCVIIYCAFSFGAMLLYNLVGAADVAFTEAVIGTISTVYFVIAIKSVSRRKKDEQEK